MDVLTHFSPHDNLCGCQRTPILIFSGIYQHGTTKTLGIRCAFALGAARRDQAAKMPGHGAGACMARQQRHGIEKPKMGRRAVYRQTAQRRTAPRRRIANANGIGNHRARRVSPAEMVRCQGGQAGSMLWHQPKAGSGAPAYRLEKIRRRYHGARRIKHRDSNSQQRHLANI